MLCGHCNTHFTESWAYYDMDRDREGLWKVRTTTCDNEACKRVVIDVLRTQPQTNVLDPSSVRPVRPRTAARPLPVEVEDPYRSDFEEAAITLPDSAKASAALSRRCL